MSFPTDRPRRLRRTAAMRQLVRETDVLPRHLIQPLFIEPGTGVNRPLKTLPGQLRYSPDTAAQAARRCEDLGIPAVLLFGVPDEKDAIGTEAWNPEGPVQQAIRAIRAAAPSLVIVTDLCLCEYTDHGHCGPLEHDASGACSVQNDATLPLLADTARSYAECGADVVAPSGMMDGMVQAIRAGLDDAGYTDVAIMSYAVKYSSAFYGPFRDVVDSAPQSGDRRGYQMDPGNVREGLREAALDAGEGADFLMVKPAGAYLDVIARVRDATHLPLAAYQVSGEYAMIKFSAEAGLIDGRAAMWESVRSIRRAGADIVITYFAMELATEHKQEGTT